MKQKPIKEAGSKMKRNTEALDEELIPKWFDYFPRNIDWLDAHYLKADEDCTYC